MSCPSWVFFPPDQIASVLLATSDMACFQTQSNLPSSWLLFHQFPLLRSWCLIFRLTTQLGSGPKQDHHSLFLHTIILLPFPKIVLLNCWTTIYLRKKVSMIKISWESTSYSIPLLEIHRAFSTLKPPKSWITLIHLSFPTCMRPSNPFPFMKLTNNLQNEYSTEYALESTDPRTQPTIMLHFFVSQLPHS